MTLRQPTERHGGNARFDEEVTVMVSKAVASLDAWLQQAEAVLRDQELLARRVESATVDEVHAPSEVLVARDG